MAVTAAKVRVLAFVVLTGVLTVMMITTLLLFGVEPHLVFTPGFAVKAFFEKLGFHVPNRVGVLATGFLYWSAIVAIWLIVRGFKKPMMKTLIVSFIAVLLIARCAPEKTVEVSSAPTATTQSVATSTTSTTDSAPVTTTTAATNDNLITGTWTGQIKTGQPISMFNYVGAESGDFAPIRFRNDSEAGKKILAACSNDDMCEFNGTVEWLDEPPPPDASAIGQIVSVDSAKRVPAKAP